MNDRLASSINSQAVVQADCESVRQADRTGELREWLRSTRLCMVKAQQTWRTTCIKKNKLFQGRKDETMQENIGSMASLRVPPEHGKWDGTYLRLCLFLSSPFLQTHYPSLVSPVSPTIRVPAELPADPRCGDAYWSLAFLVTIMIRKHYGL